jgi:hypothetical protein
MRPEVHIYSSLSLFHSFQKTLPLNEKPLKEEIFSLILMKKLAECSILCQDRQYLTDRKTQ